MYVHISTGKKGCDVGGKNRGWGWYSGQNETHLGKKRPIWAISAKSGQKFSRIGKKFNHCMETSYYINLHGQCSALSAVKRLICQTQWKSVTWTQRYEKWLPCQKGKMTRFTFVCPSYMNISRKVLFTFQMFCPVGVQVAQIVVHFAHFQVQDRKRGVFGWVDGVLCRYISPKGVCDC